MKVGTTGQTSFVKLFRQSLCERYENFAQKYENIAKIFWNIHKKMFSLTKKGCVSKKHPQKTIKILFEIFQKHI